MKKIFFLVFIVYTCFMACKKSEFLDTKPDNSQVVPRTLEECQQLMDNDRVMNGTNPGAGLIPALSHAGCDDYYVREVTLQNLTPANLNQYTWANDPFLGAGTGDWNYPYKALFAANQVMDQLKRLSISPSQQIQYDKIKGEALFVRAFMFYSLAQIFAPAYDKNTASSNWGIPIRLTADINETIQRSTVQQTYDRILEDLKEAVTLLPDTATYKTRGSKVACLALLSRVYQTMQDYENALIYSNLCLQINNQLLDFNTDITVNVIGNPPVSRFNKEVLFHAMMVYSVTWASGNVDSTIYATYDSNDLRKQAFIYKTATRYYFVGSYDGTYSTFAGLATDEIYLIRAECLARLGKTNEALNDLNTLLVKRWKSGNFIPLNASNPSDALKLILTERRKELIFRGTRWTDLRRLNSEGANINLSRKVSGQTYSLPANDLRYTYPIPPDVISFNPQMPQNAR